MTLLCYHPSWGGASRHQVWWGSGLGGGCLGSQGWLCPEGSSTQPRQGASEPGWNGSQGPLLHPLPLIVHVWREEGWQGRG